MSQRIVPCPRHYGTRRIPRAVKEHILVMQLYQNEIEYKDTENVG